MLGKRFQCAQVLYRMADVTAAKVCRAVCTQLAIGADMDDQINKEFV
jgi:hypothetical protein